MATIAGTYTFVKSENMVEYLQGIGLPEEKAKKIGLMEVPLTIKVNGNQISISREEREKREDLKFTIGKEFDDFYTGCPAFKRIATLDGNILTINSKTDDGRTGTKKYEFSKDGVVVTMSASTCKMMQCSSPIVAKQYYKRT